MAAPCSHTQRDLSLPAVASALVVYQLVDQRARATLSSYRLTRAGLGRGVAGLVMSGVGLPPQLFIEGLFLIPGRPSSITVSVHTRPSSKMGEPLSLVLGCISLISTIGETSSLIASFVGRCRAARHDLDNISQELTSLENILSHLKKNIATTNDQAIPKTFRKEIATSIANCGIVLRELDELLQRHNGGVGQAVCWATTGRHDATKLRLSLDGYRGTLNLALELLTQYVYLRDHCLS
jgi:Fungal N-terminal domain of STAND proteins